VYFSYLSGVIKSDARVKLGKLDPTRREYSNFRPKGLSENVAIAKALHLIMIIIWSQLVNTA
jgi:hypothetical protein